MSSTMEEETIVSGRTGCISFTIDEKNVPPKIKKTLKNAKNVTKIKNVCKR